MLLLLPTSLPLGSSRDLPDPRRPAPTARADLVFPPVGPKPGGPHRTEGPGDFLLSLGRLVPYKRIDLAIAAAERLGVRLIVAGSGPDRRRLERHAARCVEFV